MATEIDEEIRFSVDEVRSLVLECIEEIIGTNSFSDSMRAKWAASIADKSIAGLNKLNKPYKYSLTCNIMERNGAGFHSACSCFWDNTSDGVCAVHWENDTIHCHVTVFGFAL